jgi:hypothetical protein
MELKRKEHRDGHAGAANGMSDGHNIDAVIIDGEFGRVAFFIEPQGVSIAATAEYGATCILPDRETIRSLHEKLGAWLDRSA